MKNEVKKTIGELIAEGVLVPCDASATHRFNPEMKRIEPIAEKKSEASKG